MLFLPEIIQELLQFSRHKLPYRLRGIRAFSLVKSAFRGRQVAPAERVVFPLLRRVCFRAIGHWC